jgi:cysteine desulfurase
MREVSELTCANPSSTHAAGRLAQETIARSTEQLAALLRTRADRLVMTSGATESDNLAIAGGARYRADRGRHLVSMRTEHKAVTDVLDMLAKDGFDVTWVEPAANGVLDPAAFEAALRDDTQLASIMFVNNETGVIQDIEALGTICRERDILMHVDAAQAVGKIHIDLAALPVDLMSITAHKFYGPKGIGALYIADRPGCHVEPILYGGGQQRRIRPGTMSTELIAALGMTASIAAGRIDDDLAHLQRLRAALWDGIAGIDGVTLNGDPDGFPGILNVSVADIEGESLLLALEPLLVATGSACNSKSQEPSYVLRALGRSDAEAQSAIRFSFGRPTTLDEVEFAAARYRDAVARLRGLAPGAVA